jgi:hypothetical protein
MIEFKKISPSNIRTEEGTIGGATYYVKLPGRNTPETAVCFRRIHKDPTFRCTNPAGGGTYHSGTGACKFHGGNSGAHGTGITNGRSSKVTRLRLKNSIDSYLSVDRSILLNLNYELACAKAVFDEFVENSPDPTVEGYGIWLNRFLIIISSMANLVERMSRVENRNTLTAAQVLYLRATVADLFMKWIPDPFNREKAAKELASRMGGDMSVSLQPSEIRTLSGGEQ